MDRPGVRQVREGSGEQGKMEKTGCKVICGAPPTLAVKGLMMMMMTDLRLVNFHQTPVYLSGLQNSWHDLRMAQWRLPPGACVLGRSCRYEEKLCHCYGEKHLQLFFSLQCKFLLRTRSSRFFFFFYFLTFFMFVSRSFFLVQKASVIAKKHPKISKLSTFL